MGFPAALVAVVEVDAVAMDWVVQVAAALEAECAEVMEVMEEAKEEMVDQETVTVSVVVMEVVPQEVLVVSPEALEEAVGSTAANND